MELVLLIIILNIFNLNKINKELVYYKKECKNLNYSDIENIYNSIDCKIYEIKKTSKDNLNYIYNTNKKSQKNNEYSNLKFIDCLMKLCINIIYSVFIFLYNIFHLIYIILSHFSLKKINIPEIRDNTTYIYDIAISENSVLFFNLKYINLSYYDDILINKDNYIDGLFTICKRKKFSIKYF